MSRRKQARPIRHLEDDEEGLASALPNGESSTSGSEDEGGGGAGDELTCRQCGLQFLTAVDCLEHSRQCCAEQTSDAEELADDDEEEDDCGGKQLRRRQDAENNNGGEAEELEEAGDSLPPPPLGFPFAGHVTLEALQNTKVAVAQFAATAMANNADNAAALQELAVLQSTLFTLQHQQVMQLSLIQQLQQQLQITRSKEGSPVSPPPPAPAPAPSPAPRLASPAKLEPPLPPPPPPPAACQAVPATQSQPMPPQPPRSSPAPAAATTLIVPKPPSPPVPPPPPPPPPMPLPLPFSMCSISSSLASTIITNSDPLPLPNEPNSLEMLQRRAQEVLDNASQGLLANNLADELAFRKGGKGGSLSPYDGKSGGRNEPFFKHRCRYCGKVFGSDSALQIHIRSHTGERPFKCNVCGSRFTTKGNLKVHFQRHTAKFPHVKMNPNPVPEHLDKYHPPLLTQMQQSGAASPGIPPHHPPPPPPPHHPFHPGGFPPAALPLYRPPPPPPPHDLLPHHLHPPPSHRPLEPHQLPPHTLFGHRVEQDVPENLSKPQATSSPLPIPERVKKEPPDEEMVASTTATTAERMSPKYEPETDQEQEEADLNRYLYDDDCSLDSKYSSEDSMGMQEQPENLSSKQELPAAGQRLPPSLPFPQTMSPLGSTSSGSGHAGGSLDPAKDPAIYTSLLPRPGSNDNSWESLIEVTKTSETSKLQQLVDNIEHKLTDPNQCVICHRVLSCKSALQMHYRTHTGERPFKCKICGRAFTTKGNLKTHMGVHRAKPPVRVLHQCPVCHKKFTNALVLQQHIRLHTGEPTDLTPEQIQAAEIKDYPPPAAFSLPNSMSPFLAHGFPVPPHHLALKQELDERRERDAKDDFLDDDNSNSSGGLHGAFSTSLAALENQVRTITTMASASVFRRSVEDLRHRSPTPVNGDRSPGGRQPTPAAASPGAPEMRASPSPPLPPLLLPHHRPLPAASPAISESGSLGALDLTPRSSVAAPPPPPPPPPHGVFSSFSLVPPPPPGSSPLMTSALSSLTSSVLTSTAFNPLGLAVCPAVRPGNTTCNICFKTFACNSALEIHYRSHTKERPFKCTVCDRGFSTKGYTDPLDAQPNHACMCDHWGQWRIQQGFGGGRDIQTTQAKPKRTRKRNEESRKQNGGSKKYTARIPPLPLLGSTGYAPDWNPLLGNMKQHMLTHKIRDMPSHLFEPNKPGPPPLAMSDDSSNVEEARQPPPPHLPPPHHDKPDLGIKRSPPEGEGGLPIPKRPPGLAKHLCHVCNKNFSSSSALQIHMRTHTGDKPFRCTICQKAFTTKGNLKVHMGTHMWSNGASRRGRRMSLDLPPIPMTPKDSEFLQRRPDLFYPYLPAPFLNGMQQKLNEISVIQSVNSSNGRGLSPPVSKYGPLLSFGGYGGGGPDKPLLHEPPRSQTNSPLSDKPPSSSVSSPPPLSLSLGSHHGSSPPSRESAGDERGMWDLHYERKAVADEPMDVAPSPPGHVNSHATPRGEGLAA